MVLKRKRRSYDFNIAAKNEVISQLNSMFNQALDNKEEQIKKLQAENEKLKKELAEKNNNCFKLDQLHL
jgi:Tfp pilus assembly protein PilO